MAELLTPATLEFFARYLLAGHVVILTRSAFVAGLRPKPAELVVEAVIFSLVVQMATVPFALERFVGPQVDLLIDVLAVPGALGALLGIVPARGWARPLLRRLSLPASHPIERGHDFAFGQGRPPGFVILTFEDGTTIQGWFGEGSLASSDPERSDLFLERLYTEGDEGPSRSALISLSGIRSIEFLDPEENSSER